MFGIGGKRANTQSQPTTQVNIETEVKDANTVSNDSNTPSSSITPNASSVDDDLSALINQL